MPRSEIDPSRGVGVHSHLQAPVEVSGGLREMTQPQNPNRTTQVERRLSDDFPEWWERGVAGYYAEKSSQKDGDAQLLPSSSDKRERRAA